MNAPALSRRTLLTQSAVIAAMLPTTAAAGPSASGPSARILAMIEADKVARKVADERRTAVSDIDEAHDFPLPTVQHGFFYRGRDDDGNEIRDPIYCYSERQIEERVNRDRDVLLAMETPSPRLWPDGWPPEIEAKSAVARQRINDSAAQILADKLADFRQQVAELKALEDATGKTTAVAAAKAASDEVEVSLDALLYAAAGEDRTMADVRAVARHLADLHEAGADDVTDDRLLLFVKVLAGVELPPSVEREAQP